MEVINSTQTLYGKAHENYKLTILYDFPNSQEKYCSYESSRLGHCARMWVDALCLSGFSTITCRWKHMFLLNIGVNVKPQTYMV
jgi:hypothetical protein